VLELCRCRSGDLLREGKVGLVTATYMRAGLKFGRTEMSDRIAELEEMLKDSNQRVSELQERLVTLRAATTRTLMLISQDRKVISQSQVLQERRD